MVCSHHLRCVLLCFCQLIAANTAFSLLVPLQNFGTFRLLYCICLGWPNCLCTCLTGLVSLPLSSRSLPFGLPLCTFPASRSHTPGYPVPVSKCMAEEQTVCGKASQSLIIHRSPFFQNGAKNRGLRVLYPSLCVQVMGGGQRARKHLSSLYSTNQFLSVSP